MNQVILVGRIANDLELKKENDKKMVLMTIAVSRSFKNSDGVYETDFVPCTLWDSIAKNASEYCHKGNVVGVKGRIQSDNDKFSIIAEKVTFLSSKEERN